MGFDCWKLFASIKFRKDIKKYFVIDSYYVFFQQKKKIVISIRYLFCNEEHKLNIWYNGKEYDCKGTNFWNVHIHPCIFQSAYLFFPKQNSIYLGLFIIIIIPLMIEEIVYFICTICWSASKYVTNVTYFC
jgi:hypothetical protein